MHSHPRPHIVTDPTHPDFYGVDYYESRLHDHHWFRDSKTKHRDRWNSVMGLLEPAPTDTVLDLGCAHGSHALKLRSLVSRVLGVDFSAAAIEMARTRGAGDPRLYFVCTSVARMPEVDSSSIDKAVAIDLLEHLDDTTLAAMLREVWRVLRPGGRFVFYTPCASHYVERMKAAGLLRQLPGHIAVRSGERYHDMFAALPWRNLKIDYLPSGYPLFRWLDAMMLRIPGVGRLFRFRVVGALSKP